MGVGTLVGTAVGPGEGVLVGCDWGVGVAVACGVGDGVEVGDGVGGGVAVGIGVGVGVGLRVGMIFIVGVSNISVFTPATFIVWLSVPGWLNGSVASVLASFGGRPLCHTSQVINPKLPIITVITIAHGTQARTCLFSDCDPAAVRVWSSIQATYYQIPSTW